MGTKITVMGTKITIKARKRYRFHIFCDDPGSPCDFKGTFGDKIREFIQKYGDTEDLGLKGCGSWCTLLVHEKGDVIPLYIIEESVENSTHLEAYCDLCRFNGWGSHFVSKRRYHFIIPADGELRKSPNKSSILNQRSHLLHGYIHCNGFGHLLRINGLKGGSQLLRGREIMDLWDRICNALRPRKITVMDLSRKRSMDLRLLYGVAYGHPWSGRWGYKFHRGSFGVTEHKYHTAIGLLRSLNVDKIVEDCSSKGRNHMEKIIKTYRGWSETPLITLEDFLRFMLVTHNAFSTPHSVSSSNIWNKSNESNNSNYKKPREYRNIRSFAAETAKTKYSATRLQNVANTFVDALKEKGSAMSRLELREVAIRQKIDHGMVDFLLAYMDNMIVGKYAVHRRANERTGKFSFTVHELGQTSESISASPVAAPLTTTTTSTTTNAISSTCSITDDSPGSDVYKDVLHIYKEVFLLGNVLSKLSASVVLNCKDFVKEWPLKDEQGFLTFVCRLKQSSSLSPGDLVVVPIYTTIGQLKKEIQCTLRDTYCWLDTFEVTEIEGLGEFKDEDVLPGSLESGANIWVLGNVWGEDQLKHEAGDAAGWVVDCSCGAKNDDGERMIACSDCDVREHTRCCGIKDIDEPPEIFRCVKCRGPD